MRFHPQKTVKMVPLHFQDGFKKRSIWDTFCRFILWHSMCNSIPLFLFSYFVLFYIPFSILFLSFFSSTADQKNGLGWHNLSTCSLLEAYLMFKYKIRLSLESCRRQKCFSVPTAKFLVIPSETHNRDFRNVSRNIINSNK
jgi:hypothetical protein